MERRSFGILGFDNLAEGAFALLGYQPILSHRELVEKCSYDGAQSQEVVFRESRVILEVRPLLSPVVCRSPLRERLRESPEFNQSVVLYRAKKQRSPKSTDYSERTKEREVLVPLVLVVKWSEDFEFHFSLLPTAKRRRRWSPPRTRTAWSRSYEARRLGTMQ